MINEGRTLDAFVCNPLYDGVSMPKLIGQFVDGSVKFASDNLLTRDVTTRNVTDVICEITDELNSRGTYRKSDLAEIIYALGIPVVLFKFGCGRQ